MDRVKDDLDLLIEDMNQVTTDGYNESKNPAEASIFITRQMRDMMEALQRKGHYRPGYNFPNTWHPFYDPVIS